MSTVKITLSPLLDCGKCDEVLLRLNNPLLLDANIGLDPADYNVFIRGKIVDVTEISSGVAEYTIEYDETLLTDPEGGIEAVEIKEVCCLTCLYDWLQGTAICEILQGAPSTCFSGIELFTLSADGGTIETIVGGDEIRLFGGDSIFTDASNPDTVTIDLVLSGDVGNILYFGTDGNLYLSCPDVLSCINVQNPITGDGSGGAPFGIALSADAGNILELRVDGLYVADTNTNLTCADVRSCIFVANPISGTGSNVDPFTVDISADIGNILELRGDGLFVPNTDTVLDCASVRACINVANPISGDGSLATPFTVDISADAANVLELRLDGLYVPAVTETVTTLAPGALSPSGARRYDYTSENATVTAIVDGIDEIVTTGVANEGVGAGFMLKHVSISPATAPNRNRLNIRSAPELAHDASYVGFTDNIPVPLDATGVYNNPTFGPYVFNNPFSSRRAAIIVSTSYEAAWQRVTGNSPLDFQFTHQKSINGGAFVNVSVRRRAFSANGTWISSLRTADSAMDTVNGPLPIGGSINVRLRSIVNVISAGPAGSVLVPQNGAVGVEFFSTS